MREASTYALGTTTHGVAGESPWTPPPAGTRSAKSTPTSVTTTTRHPARTACKHTRALLRTEADYGNLCYSAGSRSLGFLYSSARGGSDLASLFRRTHLFYLQALSGAA